MHIHNERISAHSHATGIGTERAIQPSNTNDHLDRDLRTRQIERSLNVLRSKNNTFDRSCVTPLRFIAAECSFVFGQPPNTLDR